MGTTSVWSQEPVFRHYTQADGLPSSAIYDLHQDQDGFLWMTSEAGVLRYDGYAFELFTEADGLSPALPGKIVAGSGDDLYFEAADHSISRWNGSEFEKPIELQVLREGAATSLAAIGERVWVSAGDSVVCLQAGLVEFVLDMASWAQTERKPIRIHSLISTPEDKVWAVANEGVLSLDTGIPDSVIYFSDSIAGANTIPFITSSNHLGLWIQDQGCFFLDENMVKPLWVGGETMQNELASMQVAEIYVYHESYWIAHRNGLHLFHPTAAGWQVEHFLVGSDVTSVLHDREGNLWVATLAGGLFLASNNALQMRVYPKENAYSSRVFAIADSALGVARRGGPSWEATLSDGLWETSGRDALRFREADGLAGNRCTDLFVASADEVWVGTAQGLSCVRRTNDQWRVRSYTTNDGLPSNSIDSIAVVNDTLFAATPAGLVLFKPDELARLPAPPSVIIRSIELQTADSLLRWPTMERFSLSSDVAELTFRLAVISFTNEGNVMRFRYRIRSSSDDGAWQETMDRHVTLSGLTPGDYRFEIQAVSLDGRFGPSKEMRFNLAPSFYESAAFILLLASLGLLLLVVFIRRRKSSARAA